MNVYYLFDPTEQQRLNSTGEDYSPVYLKALAIYLGITAMPIAPCELNRINEEDLLIVGASKLSRLPDCKLLLLGTSLKEDPPIPQRVRRVFAAYETIKGERIPLFVPLCAPVTDGEILAYAYTEDGEKHPALLKTGETVYEFCFDLAASVWFSEDGFLPDTPSDYFFIHRTPDTRPLEHAKNTQTFNDLLLCEIETILSHWQIPMIAKQMPCENGDLPDLVFHFSGDDDCSSLQYNLEAAKTMQEFGLPYHINAMPKRGEAFVMTKEEFDEVASHGCEIALHTDFTDGVVYGTESVKAQVALFEKTFGKHPVTNTNHCFIQGGTTAERMRFFHENGIIADNGKMGEFDPADINAFDLCEFGFGTAFPRYTCDDAAHGNTLIPSLEIPISYYEPRLREDPTKIVEYLENGVKYGRILQFFIHPHYLAHRSSQRPLVLNALHLMQTHIREKGYRVLYTTTNEIARFWHSRADAQVTPTQNGYRIRTDVPIFLKVGDRGQTFLLNGKKVEPILRLENGTNSLFIPIPEGTQVLSEAGF